MKASFAVCVTDFYIHKYLDFLLEHYKELQLPYPFPTAFQYISSVVFGKECILCLDHEGEAIGAFGYIHGTGEHDYEDRHVIQLQVRTLYEIVDCLVNLRSVNGLMRQAMVRWMVIV